MLFLGNKNNFETEEECAERCEPSKKQTNKNKKDNDYKLSYLIDKFH